MRSPSIIWKLQSIDFLKDNVKTTKKVPGIRLYRPGIFLFDNAKVPQFEIVKIYISI